MTSQPTGHTCCPCVCSHSPTVWSPWWFLSWGGRTVCCCGARSTSTAPSTPLLDTTTWCWSSSGGRRKKVTNHTLKSFKVFEEQKRRPSVTDSHSYTAQKHHVTILTCMLQSGFLTKSNLKLNLIPATYQYHTKIHKKSVCLRLSQTLFVYQVTCRWMLKE